LNDSGQRFPYEQLFGDFYEFSSTSAGLRLLLPLRGIELGHGKKLADRDDMSPIVLLEGKKVALVPGDEIIGLRGVSGYPDT
jgi:hypothetical protein